MTIWRTYFERINFDYNPPLKQASDVVFETDIPSDDAHIEAFEQSAWNAMWKQNPHWRKSAGPIKTRRGWSSVLGGKTYKVIG